MQLSMVTMSGVSNKICLLTNAGTSFAYSVARHLGLAGAQLLLTDPDERKLQFVLDGLKGADVPTQNIEGIPAADLSAEEARTDFFERVRTKVGALDAVIHTNSPNTIIGPIMQSTQEDLIKEYSQFVNQPFLLTKNALPLLQQSKNPSVLFVSSMTAYTPYMDIGLYSVVQAAVIGLSKSMAQSLAGNQPPIRVNTLALGMFEDDGANAVWSGCSAVPRHSDAAAVDQMRQALLQAIPLGRLGKSADTFGLIEFLISDKAGYLTGEVFSLTGGLSIRF